MSQHTETISLQYISSTVVYRSLLLLNYVYYYCYDYVLGFWRTGLGREKPFLFAICCFICSEIFLFTVQAFLMFGPEIAYA